MGRWLSDDAEDSVVTTKNAKRDSIFMTKDSERSLCPDHKISSTSSFFARQDRTLVRSEQLKPAYSWGLGGWGLGGWGVGANCLHKVKIPHPPLKLPEDRKFWPKTQDRLRSPATAATASGSTLPLLHPAAPRPRPIVQTTNPAASADDSPVAPPGASTPGTPPPRRLPPLRPAPPHPGQTAARAASSARDPAGSYLLPEAEQMPGRHASSGSPRRGTGREPAAYRHDRTHPTDSRHPTPAAPRRHAANPGPWPEHHQPVPARRV
jgi:hypothetical protein